MKLIVRYPKFRHKPRKNKPGNCRDCEDCRCAEKNIAKTCPICGEPVSSGDGINCKKCGEPMLRQSADN